MASVGEIALMKHATLEDGHYHVHKGQITPKLEGEPKQIWETCRLVADIMHAYGWRKVNSGTTRYMIEAERYPNDFSRIEAELSALRAKLYKPPLATRKRASVA